MAPEMVDEAIRSFVEETNRLNYAQRADRHSAEAKLTKIRKGKADIVDAIENGRDAIENGRYGETLMDRLLDLETEALNRPEDRDEAADAICGLIERGTLTPGANRRSGIQQHWLARW